jgi:hypothetical protein
MISVRLSSALLRLPVRLLSETFPKKLKQKSFQTFFKNGFFKDIVQPKKRGV